MLQGILSTITGPRTLPPGLAFLFKLAWQSKVRLPILIAVVFMLSDYHLQLEINVNIHMAEVPAQSQPEQQEAGAITRGRIPAAASSTRSPVVLPAQDSNDSDEDTEDTSDSSDESS